MKLLLDQNLSARLVTGLQGTFPGTAHVSEFGLESSEDLDIWVLAQERGFVILSKDEEFRQLSYLHGHPPKVIWANLGNCTTNEILRAPQAAAEDIADFEADEHASILSRM